MRAASIVSDASKSWRAMPGFAPGIHGLLLWRKDLNQRS
jgi:hypothetical protein